MNKHPVLNKPKFSLHLQQHGLSYCKFVSIEDSWLEFMLLMIHRPITVYKCFRSSASAMVKHLKKAGSSEDICPE